MDLSDKQKALVIPIIIFLAAFTVRVIAMYYYQFVGIDGGTDGVAYAECGRNIFSGHGLTFYGKAQTYHPPFYSLLIGIVWLCTRNLEFSGQFVSVAMGSLLVFPVYFLVKNFYGNRAALYSSVLLLLQRNLITSSITIRAEAAYVTLVLLAVFAGYKAITTKKVLWAGFLAVWVSLAYLTKPEGMIFFFGFGVLIFVSSFFVKNKSSSSLCAREGLFIGIFLLFVTPYLLFLHGKTGKWSISGKTASIVLDTELDKEGSELNVEKMRFESFADNGRLQKIQQNTSLSGYVCANIKIFMKKIMVNSRDMVKMLRNLFPLPVIALLVIGFFGGPWERQRVSKEIFLLFTIIILSIPILIFFVKSLYLLPFIPFFLLWTGKGISDVEAFCRRVFGDKGIVSGKTLGYCIVILPVVLFSLQSTQMVRYMKEHSPYEYKLMGEWLKANIPDIEKKTITARKLGVSFYAGAQWKVLYYGSYQGLIRYMRQQHIDYLVVDTWTTPGTRPKFAFLLHEDANHPELEKLKATVYKDRKVIVYQLKEQPGKKKEPLENNF